MRKRLRLFPNMTVAQGACW